MSESADSMIHSQTRRAVEALQAAGDPGLTKGELAQAVWGAVTPSTQSMTTRLTQQLEQAGRIRESRDGRNIFVRLVEQNALVSSPQPLLDFSHSLERLYDASWRRIKSGDQRPFDRPFFHLAHVAKVVARGLDRRDEDNRTFAEVLLRILDTTREEEASEAREDREAIYAVAARLPHGSFLQGLARALGTFALEHDRDYMARDLLAIKPDPAHPCSLLWAAMAIPVARRLWLIGEDRAHEDYERLQRRVRKSLGGALEAQAPVHVAYLRAKYEIATGDLFAGAWEPLTKLRPPPRARGTKLDEEIANDEQVTVQNGEFNFVLSIFSRQVDAALRPAVARRLGFANDYTHDHGAPPHVAEGWARSHVEALRAVLPKVQKEVAGEWKPTLKRRFKALISKRASLTPTAQFQVDQMRFFVEGAAFDDIRDRAPSPRSYDRLIRNNYWTPGMLWTDIAIHAQ